MRERQKDNCRRAVSALLGLGLLGACQKNHDEPRPDRPRPAPVAEPSRPAAAPAPSVAPAVPSLAVSPALGAAKTTERCPEGMALIPGGEFWLGSARASGPADERPRAQIRLATFCLDRTEVTTAAFEACVSGGSCERPAKKNVTCNAFRRDRGAHPINCVTWSQAQRYCDQRGARLPSEAEWEYAARGGGEQRRYSWGDEPPDGRTCWKGAGSCPVQSFPAGAFGLFDMVGNVWEWTRDWYGPYPWPSVHGHARVYRGGSWSRRFEKWLSPTLRNRQAPDDSGSHLGFRCAVTPPGVTCPAGVHEGGGCLREVLQVECSAGNTWNGQRCAAPGAPLCRPGFSPKPGFGCVEDEPVETAPEPVDPSAVSRARAPEYDSDCARNFPGRPQAYRYVGGTHRARNVVSRGAGCKNRDVGSGWNSTCCP